MRLRVDRQDVRMNAFVARILTNVMEGISRSLDDIPKDSQEAVFTAEAGSGVTLEVDGIPVKMNAFVQSIVGNILRSMVTSLDDVPAAPRSIEVIL
ncbi:MAG: hypothetical protein WBB73_12310 [Candidatus Aminicenantaceae bacterium]